MATSVKISGAQICVIGTEHTLGTIVDAGTYELCLDMALGALGEEFEVKFYSKVRSTDTERLADTFTLRAPFTRPFRRCPVFPTPHSFRMTLKQINGTGRSIPWAVYAL